MKKFGLLVLVAVLLVSMFAAPIASAQEAAPKKLIFIVKSMAMSFFLDVIEGAEAAAADLGVEIKCVGPETPFSVEEQIQIVEQAIIDGVDGVCIIPADSAAVVTAIRKCNEAGVPVLTPNTKANGGDVLTWIGADNVDVGYRLGKIMCESINGEGNVVLLEGTPGNSTAEERTEGYKLAIDEYPGVTLIDSQPANFSREEGMMLMENFLQMYPDIDACGSGNKDMSMGALEAIKNAGRLDQIKVITFDTDADVVAGIQNGEVFATGDQDPFSQGYLSVAAMVANLNGCAIPSQMYLPLRVIDSSNIDEFAAAMRK
jgi:ABC-type sugar transport system, periplasmic component